MKRVRREDVKRRKRKPQPRPSALPWQRDIMQIIAEQMGVPMDLVAGFMKVDRAAAVRAMNELAGLKWVNVKQFFVNDEPWVWLTREGMKNSGTNYVAKTLTPSAMPHYRGICEVRLNLEAEYPDGEWVCEREMWRRLRNQHHIPDAVFKVPNAEGQIKHWAIEVERTQKTAERYAEVVAHRCAHYHRVLYYCTPQIKRKFDQIPEFKHSKVLVTPFFKEHSEVKNFQWRLFPGPDPMLTLIPEKIEQWQAEVVRLLAEQEAVPIDQFARFLKRDLKSAQAVAGHLRASGLVAQGLGPADEGSWLWPTVHGGRLAQTGLKALPPSLLVLQGVRARNEARLYARELYPRGQWWSKRMLLQGNKGATVPAGVIREGKTEYAVEIEPEARSKQALTTKYERRYVEYKRQGRRLIVFCPPHKVTMVEEVKEKCGWADFLVKGCPAFDTRPGQAQKPKAKKPKRKQSTVPLIEIHLDDIPAELLQEIAAREGAPPKVKLAGKRKGKGFPRWRVTTEREVWRATDNPFGWTLRVASKAEREEKLLPQGPRKPPPKPPAPEGSIPLREIRISELPSRVLQEIQAKEGAPPKVKQAAKRIGGGHHRWRVTTERNVWRVTYSPWGWVAKPSGPKERVQRLLPMEGPVDPPEKLIELDPSELPAEVLQAIQEAASSPFEPQVISVGKRTGGGALRLRVETDMGIWRAVCVAGKWKVHPSE